MPRRVRDFTVPSGRPVGLGDLALGHAVEVHAFQDLSLLLGQLVEGGADASALLRQSDLFDDLIGVVRPSSIA